MSYKFVYPCNLNAENDIVHLRNKFNTKTKQYYFKTGNYKGSPCIFVLNNLSTKTYAEPVPSKQFKGCLFFPPLEEINIDDFELFKDKRDLKIKVSLVNGKELYIVPATMMPRKVIFDFNDDEGTKEDVSSPYSLSEEYGQLSYKLFQDLENKVNIELTSPLVKKLVMLALQKSYNLPIDVINHIGIISSQDLDPLLSSALGINPDLLQKKSGSLGE